MSGCLPDIARFTSRTRNFIDNIALEHLGNPLKYHFTDCGISPTDDDVSILGKPKRGEYRLLTLEALFIKELAPVLNTKDEYRNRTLTLKF